MSEETGQTKFNMAVATLMRMDTLLKIATSHCMAGNYSGWIDTLFILRREIAPYITDKEFEEIDNKFKELRDIHWQGKQMDGTIMVIQSEVGNLNEILDSIAIKINRSMDKAGILMPKTTEGGWD